MEYLFVFIVFVAMVSVMVTISTIPESNVGVLTLFGRYCGLIQSGFNIVAPWKSVQVLSLQNRAIELKFQAITLDQANVHLDCTVLYSVLSNDVDTIKRAVYTFASEKEFEISLRRLLEDETRSYVATKKQADMIGLSQEVVIVIKARIDEKINEWGYGLEDLRYHNLQFDSIVTSSMARVVAAINEREAAEHEGQALLIRKTKEAEANGEFVRIEAEAERTAWKLRGQGL
jgi:regulator of protease activity HflC (stomatin/prohibitin superfamily)